MGRFVSVCLALVCAGDLWAQSWQEEADQHVMVDMKVRLYGRDRVFGSYRPRKTRLVKTLPGYQARTHAELSRYGGWLGRRVEARGFFYVTKVDGRWWLVDPDGYLFLNTALNSVRPGPRGGAGHGVPPDQRGRWKDTAAWAAETVQFLRETGFSAVGTWSDRSLQEVERPLVWSTVIYLMYPFGRRYGARANENNMSFPGDCIPIFDPDFEAFCRERVVQKVTAEMVRDPTLLGYYVDNELPWRRDALDRYLAMDERDINHRKALEWVREKRGGGARGESTAEAIRSSITDADRDEFLSHIARKYFSIVSGALRAVDPNHLYLGSRLHGRAARLRPVFAALGEYADVISVNYYHRWTPRKAELNNWETWSSGKPFLISEWYVKGDDTGRRNEDGAGGVVRTQRDRGRFYQNFALGLLESKSCVGWSWHNYRDTVEPPEGSNKGFLDYAHKPFTDLVDMAGEINTQVYPLIEYFDRR